MIDHNHPAQQITGQSPVLFIHRHQITCKPQNARFPERAFLIKGTSVSNTRQGKKCGPAVFIFFQIFNQLFRRLLRIGYDILNTSAKSRLNRRLIFFCRGNNIRHNAVYPDHTIPDLHNAADAVAVAVVALCQIL